jgi:hypothetical protein
MQVECLRRRAIKYNKITFPQSYLTLLHGNYYFIGILIIFSLISYKVTRSYGSVDVIMITILNHLLIWRHILLCSYVDPHNGI